MRLIEKKIRVVLLLMTMLLWITVPAIEVAAAGKTTIAVSEGAIEVGDTVSVTINAKSDSGSSAKTKMKVTYDDDVLKFVSCSATYDGGAGGSVTATASSMTIKFEAIAVGKSPIYVDASDGVEDSSTNIKVNESTNTSTGKYSKDNSLKSLSLSAGTISPDFAGNVVKYTATVPNEVTDVEVMAETANEKASIESIAGNTDLQLGLNTIRIVVEAENGALATYTIELTREEAVEVVPPEVVSPEEPPVVVPEEPEVSTEKEITSSEIVESKEEESDERYQDLENRYQQLEEKYQREKAFSRKVIYTLFFVIGFLIVLMINIILHYRRKLEDDFDDDFEDDFDVKPVKKPAMPKSENKKIEEKKPGEKVSEEKLETKNLEIKKPEESKSEIEKKEKTKIELKKKEEPKKNPAPKVEVRNNLEVFDFNDED